MTQDAPAPENTQASPEGEDINLFGGLDAAPEVAPEVAPGVERMGEDAPTERPEWLPEKFKSPEAMAAAYRELEKAYHSKTLAPEEYQLELPEGLELTPEDAEVLRGMGLTNEQAQKFVGFVFEEIVPAVQEARVELHAERLGRSWGMEPESQAFQQRLTNLHSWAKQNLPEGVVQEMARSANGVNALYQMMQAQRDGTQVARGPLTNAPARPTEQELAKLMEDPRYQYDDDYKNYVRQQFIAAYD